MSTHEGVFTHHEWSYEEVGLGKVSTGALLAASVVSVGIILAIVGWAGVSLTSIVSMTPWLLY